MKFPTIKEMAEEVAEKALDEFEYKGKTLRQWINIISASEHGTNLAEVGRDCISRQQAIDTVNGLIDRFEQILRDIREANVDDSVCGMCEYDGAYIGQSGGWCNECPGFDKDDCFKLSDKTRKKWTEEIIKALPPIQPEIVRCKDCKHHWTHKCMDSMPIERCDLGQTFYDAEVDFCSLAEKREVNHESN